MPFQIIRNDITKIKCDAIVNPTDRYFSGSGGLDAAIHAKAGPELRKKCSEIGTCPTGGAVATPAFHLPCDYIIHTVGPVWHGVFSDDLVLRKCYTSSLSLALELGCETVAVPVVSGGTHRYPEERALSVAEKAIKDFLNNKNDELTVFLVVYGRNMTYAGRKLFGRIFEFIDDNYTGTESKTPRTTAPGSEKRNYLNFLEGAEYCTDGISGQFAKIKKPYADYKAGFSIPIREDPAEEDDITLPYPADFDSYDYEDEAQCSVEEEPVTDGDELPFSYPSPPCPHTAAEPVTEEDELPFSYPCALRPGAAAEQDKKPEHTVHYDAVIETYPKSESAQRPNAKPKAAKAGLFALKPHGIGAPAPELKFELDESFAQMLFRKIDEKGMKDSECYKRANMPRQAFSKLRCDPDYHPGKPRAYALAVALNLSLDETKELLEKAGYAMSKSVLMDVILEYFISNRIYDIFEINDVLFAYDQPLLG